MSSSSSRLLSSRASASPAQKLAVDIRRLAGGEPLEKLERYRLAAVGPGDRDVSILGLEEAPM
jgi:hypothetical protein